MPLFGRNRERDQETGYRSRLEEVQHEIRDRAIFWDKTSIGIFLGFSFCAGLVLFLIGLGSLQDGQMTIPLLRSAGFSGWQFTLFCWSLMLFGINFMLPLPLLWFLRAQLVALIVVAMLVVNFAIFSYTFVLKLLNELFTNF